MVSVLPIGDNHDLLNDSLEAKDRKVEMEFVHPIQVRRAGVCTRDYID